MTVIIGFLKFGFSEKAEKICPNFQGFDIYFKTIKKIAQIFVAFSVKLIFTHQTNYFRILKTKVDWKASSKVKCLNQKVSLHLPSEGLGQVLWPSSWNRGTL